ncbi:YlbL family protein [Bifidobacterium pluvialisilvae]|uniref:YlbL family protein n=1 Tax=Bifidobacterium pluvialisilvae TaxID=2834436 RepID=UPI003557A7F8
MHLKRAKFAVSAMPSRIMWYFRVRGLKYSLGLIGAVLCVVMLCMPSGYVTEGPGPTRDVLGTVGTDDAGGSGDARPMIVVKGAKTHDDTGRLLLTTVNSYGIDWPPTNAEALVAWANPHAGVLPREAVIPPGQSGDDYTRTAKKEMTGAQDTASAQALKFLAARGMDTSGVTISMNVDEIGGPSAGMMYALGAIDKLTAQNETGGRTIAGTGTIDKDGKVGAIGGIRLKMLGAKRDGATWFLAPKDNCDEVVGHVPAGLRDVSVSNLSEAYKALVAIGQGKGGSLPHCAVK